MGVSFSHPWALALLASASVLIVLFLRAERKWRRGLLLFGITALNGANPSDRLRRANRALVVLGITLLALGIASPRWGVAAPEEIKVGSDVMAVLDLSRSMLAEQPSRAEVARRVLRDLGETVRKRGGHRLGLIVFAARPKLLVPLTKDYDHFLEMMERFDPSFPPRSVLPPAESKAPSGTRIGAALRTAVEVFEQESQSGRHIILVSDGDDPANDEEWIDGAEAARQSRIPVHTLGVGNPEANARIPAKEKVAGEVRDGWLWFGDDYVRTSLKEKILQDISQRSGGEHLALGSSPVPDSWFRRILEHAPETEEATDGTTAPSRHVWFFAAALVCFLLALILEKLPAFGESRRVVALGTLLVALLLISGERQALDALRRGNQAFADGKFDVALGYFEKAEGQMTDPGWVAFNKAAALYRLGRFREAQLHYQRCLEDDQIPTLRKAQALYNLGNSLVKQAEAKDRRLLSEAIRAYELSLAEESDKTLQSDTKHNLELARLLWQAAPPSDNDLNDSKTGDSSHKQQPEMKEGQANSKSGRRIDGSGTEANGKRAQGANKESIPGGGTSPSLPDSDQPTRLSSEDVLKLLAEAARRIEADQRNAERRAGRGGVILKDW